MAEYKPSDFFIGIVDFFAILLPGSLLCFLFLDFEAKIFGPVLPPLNGDVQRWVAFAVASYISGHFLFAMGGAWDHLYDSTYRRYKIRRDGDLSKSVTPLFAGHPGYSDKIPLVIWATAFVRAKSDAAASEIDRLEADSKSFRGLSVALVFFSIKLAFGWH
jgi:hypothetical protein